MTSSSSSAPPSSSFTDRLSAATKEIHKTSDDSVNWKLSLVLTSRQAYAEAISLFWVVYLEIETLLLDAEHDLKKLQPVVQVFRRASRFEADMKSLLGSEELAEQLMERRRRPREHAYSPPELQEYVKRLRSKVKENPLILIAYTYTMYGAIIGGGHIISKMVKRAFGLKFGNSSGVELFELDLEDTAFASRKAVWKELKRILNEDMDFTQEQEDMIFKEAQQVFRNNNKLVATVQATSAFGIAASDCAKRIGMAVAVAVAVVAAVVVLYT